jgi:RNA polymerase sigma factor (TIGR02999 family)
MSDVTRILTSIGRGEPDAASQLLPLVYDELRKLAADRLAREKPGHSLQATALVHEAYLRLLGNPESSNSTSEERAIHWNGRGHFFGAAALAMRRILVESARRKGRSRHGGGRDRVELDEIAIAIPDGRPPEEILALDEALTRLASADPVAAQIVQIHFFAGQSIEETADILGMSRATAYRQWAYARAWLRLEIDGEPDAGAV